MGDVGDTLRGLREAIQHQRSRSKEAALTQLQEAEAEAAKAGIAIAVTNDGHHWRFVYEGHLLLNFWPASAKAAKVAGKVFRCRGWKHALDEAKKVAHQVMRERDRRWTP